MGDNDFACISFTSQGFSDLIVLLIKERPKLGFHTIPNMKRSNEIVQQSQQTVLLISIKRHVLMLLTNSIKM